MEDEINVEDFLNEIKQYEVEIQDEEYKGEEE